ncbi:MAG: phosphoribosyl-ATP diphosphatase [Ruminococcus bromii]|jgi:phosphoribosyl-ATP pyrophosphohydrolase|uniref:phosphoribosyl-ATP diphosphatase n=1 Tax=Ruminococcus sp. YE282 TaxID=3158780 RepID=UPI000883BF8E|nr:phosphoribosyl-ATP diphosphatase [Ruminococcus bromii]MCI7210881.1 phosphoribosyl-ATP diphosphatase [Ruminococcus bromii]MDD6433106.1 phosphoribosyl-ATP diphosphatase [Ruminococcus bromii]MDY4084934.1 phosphoribosyl-ATP diphosphatase [Ruminococcus bromii]MDY4711377.1 phosphoribosyl-ATP diphosphatase [Ruminococcus bromii]
MNDKEVLAALYATVENRRDNPKEGSYTCYLLDKGIDKILKKVGEECSETIIAAKNGVNSETVYETADLIYHLMVMLVQQGIPLDDVLAELDRRSEKTGNLKKFHVVDKNS